MNYAERERSLANHLPSIAMVVLLHIALGYALLNGLGRAVIEVLKKPLETKIIEEVKKPPPDTPPPPPPKLAAPPPPFIPPPEINIQVPVVQAPAAITQTTTVKPTTPPPVIQAPPVQQPAIRKEYTAKSRVNPAYPRNLMREGVEGKVVAWVHVAPSGDVTNVEIRQSTNRAFDREVIRALSQWKFNPEPVGFIGEYEIIFNLKD